MRQPKKIPAFFYQTVAGAEPVRDWLLSLDEEDRRTMGADIATVEYGWPVGMPTCRSLGKGLWEVRSSLAGRREARVLFHDNREADGAVARVHKEKSEDAKDRFRLGLEALEGIEVMTVKKRTKGRIGSSFDSFLKAEGRYEESQAVAIKRVLAWQIEEAMKDDAISKAEMARRMNTSRSQLDRLLDPENHAVSLEMLARAAHAVGRSLKLELA